MLNKRNFCHVVIVCDHVVVRVKYTYFRMKISCGFYSHHDLDYCSLFFVSFGTPFVFTPPSSLCPIIYLSFQFCYSLFTYTYFDINEPIFRPAGIVSESVWHFGWCFIWPRHTPARQLEILEKLGMKRSFHQEIKY